MKVLFAFPALLLIACLGSAQAQNNAPRQLGAPPMVPPPTRAKAASPTFIDTTRHVAAPAPAQVYTPTPPGQLPGGASNSTRYQVGLKSGMVYNVYDVQLKSPLFGHQYLLLDGQHKVEFSEVGFYEDETGHYVRTALPGSSRESTLRRDKTGRISLYSITSTQYNSGGMGYGSMGYGGMGYGGMGYGGIPYGNYRTVKTEYFSKDNGPIQNLSMRNLALATSDNPGAQQLLAEAQHYQKVAVASYVVGGGLLVAGFIQTLRSSPESGATVSPLLFAALPVLIIPIVMHSKQANNQRQAIALYNSNGR
jgi:hypothetical protein